MEGYWNEYREKLKAGAASTVFDTIEFPDPEPRKDTPWQRWLDSFGPPNQRGWWMRVQQRLAARQAKEAT